MANYNPKTLSISKDGNTYKYDTASVHYGICETGGSTQVKYVSIPEITELTNGLTITVYFKNAQLSQSMGSTKYPKLRLNNFDEIDIATAAYKSSTTNVVATLAKFYEWGEAVTLTLVYTEFEVTSGTKKYWIISDWGHAGLYSYGVTKLSSSTNSTDESTAATPKAVKTAYDLANGKVSCNKTNIDSALHTTSGTQKFYREDGVWEIPPGSKPVTFDLDTVTNTSGSYTHTTENEYATASMKPIQIECSNPDAFRAKVTVSITDGYITLSCDDVAGTTDVTVIAMKALDAGEGDPPAITSTEFDILNNRLINVENVVTNTPITIHASDWSNTAPYTYVWNSDLVMAKSDVIIELQDGAEAAEIEYYDAVPSIGYVTFTTNDQPQGDFPVIIKVINTKATEIDNLSADAIASEAITGQETVEDALTYLSGKLGDVPSGKTAQGQIDTLNSKIGKQLTNGSDEIANYNIFAVTVREKSISNTRCTFLFVRGASQYYGFQTTNNTYNYWVRVYIGLSGNTFAAGISFNPVLNNNNGSEGSCEIADIRGIA